MTKRKGYNKGREVVRKGYNKGQRSCAEKHLSLQIDEHELQGAKLIQLIM